MLAHSPQGDRGGVVVVWSTTTVGKDYAVSLVHGISSSGKALAIEIVRASLGSRRFVERRLAVQGRPGAIHQDPLVETLVHEGGFPKLVVANPETPAEIRNLLYNIGFLRDQYPWIVILASPGESLLAASLCGSVSLNLLPAQDQTGLDAVCDDLDSVAMHHSNAAWVIVCPQEVHIASGWRKRCAVWDQPGFHKDWRPLPPEIGAGLVREAVARTMLLRTPPPSWSRALPLVLVPLLLLAVFGIALWPASLASPHVVETDLLSDYLRSRRVTGMEYVFDGSDPLQRIARYAIGRFTYDVAEGPALEHYASQVRSSSGGVSWKEVNGAVIPPAGARVRFPVPDSVQFRRRDANEGPWRFLTGVIADTVAYVTEWYGNTGTRFHDGVDIGSRMGARILAPLSGTAWTVEDDRGGTVIGIVSGETVLLFMHCDQVLYLNGQEVVAGDPIATVGLTGHTTGPHVHVAAGWVRKGGKRGIGPVRYDPVDPVVWYREWNRKGGGR